MAEAASEQQLKALANLLLLQQRLREAATEAELGFLLVNDTQNLMAYRSAVFWVRGGRRAGGSVLSVSGAVEHDNYSPYLQWMNALCLELSGRRGQGAQRVEQAELPETLAARWQEHGAQHLIWCPVYSAAGVYLGGLALWRDQPLLESEERILNNWLLAAGYSLGALRGKAFDKRQFTWTRHRKLIAAALALAALVLMFVPVHLSVLAQAEIVPRDPLVVRSPMDGIIERIAVRPNAIVAAGDVLLVLDDTQLQTQLAVTQQTLAISRAQYQQASQSAPGNRDAKASLRVLALEIQKRESEVAYVVSLLERSDVEAESEGMVIMPSPDELIGKPVVTGERLMTIADPEQSQLEVWLPVGDDINLPGGSRIEFFPNVAPDQKFAAALTTMDYRATQTDAGELAYRIRADFGSEQSLPRIGMRGTAKLYGERVSLWYYLFRRPLATARRWIGI